MFETAKGEKMMACYVVLRIKKQRIPKNSSLGFIRPQLELGEGLTGRQKYRGWNPAHKKTV